MLPQVEAAVKKSKKVLILICEAATPLVVGIVLAIPLVLSLRRVTGQPKRFFRYFGLLIGMCLVEYLAVVAYGLGLEPDLVFLCGPSCAWGVVFGLWLRSHSTDRKVLKASVFVSLYTSLPAVCLGIIFYPLYPGHLLVLALWLLVIVLLKTVLITGEVALLILLGKKSSVGASQTGN